MSSVNNYNPKIDQSVHIFDNFYRFEADVPAQEYDVVNSYFQSVFGTKLQAANFAATMFRISSNTGIPVMTLLAQVRGLSGPQVSLTFAYYLNSFQSPTTMLGVNQPTQPNFYVAHNIKQ